MGNRYKPSNKPSCQPARRDDRGGPEPTPKIDTAAARSPAAHPLRIAGICYLAVIAGGFASGVRAQPIESHDATQVSQPAGDGGNDDFGAEAGDAYGLAGGAGRRSC